MPLYDAAIVVKELLQNSGYDVPIYVHKEPKSPNQVLTIYETGGFTPNPKWRLDYPSVQLRMRGSPGRSQDARNRLGVAADLLLGMGETILDDVYVRGIRALGGVTSLGWDQSNRPIFVYNLNIILEPVSSANRQAL